LKTQGPSENFLRRALQRISSCTSLQKSALSQACSTTVTSWQRAQVSCFFDDLHDRHTGVIRAAFSLGLGRSKDQKFKSFWGQGLLEVLFAKRTSNKGSPASSAACNFVYIRLY
jgi:hypothetical protein